VYGVSADSVASHQRFRDKYGLTVPLLADPKREACAAYGVLKDDGRGIKRQTFIIDEKGRIAHHYATVDTAVHAGEILERLAA
jgi:peroxiredoxin Q/BCP